MNQINVAECLFHIVHQLAYQPFRIDPSLFLDQFLKLYRDLEDFFYGNQLQITYFAPLYGFEMTLNNINIGQELTIRNVTTEEKRLLRNAILYDDLMEDEQILNMLLN